MPHGDLRRAVILAVALLALVVVAFSPIVHNGFINFDDDVYVTENAHLRENLRGTLRWAFTTFTASNWHPLTWLSHRLDVALFGLEPRGHHAMGLLLHASNALLLFWVLRQWTGALWKSALAAALFGVHPLHVEAVVWTAERKELLSTLFLLLTLAAYRWYVGRRNWSRYAATAVLFALGLMSKPMLVTLPLLLLCLDYWPLGRFRFGLGPTRAERAPEAPSSVLAEKLPLVLLSLSSALITWTAQSRGGAVKTFEEYPFAVRVGNALLSAVQYVATMVWPKGLAIFYPHPGPGLSAVAVLLSAALLAALTALALYNARRLPFLLAGWLWYLISLSPVLGLVQIGAQARADRYTYVPFIGLFVAIGWWAERLGRSWPRRRLLLGAAAAAALIGLATATQHQVRTWRSSVSVFEHALRVTENNFVAHDNLGTALLEAGRTREAMRHTLAALRLRPDKTPERYLRFGSALLKEGLYAEAAEVLEKALQMRPSDRTARKLLGVARAAGTGAGRTGGAAAGSPSAAE